MRKRILNDNKDLILNIRFSAEDNCKINALMHKYGYESRSDMIRDAIFHKRFVRHENAGNASAICDSLLLVSTMEELGRQLYKIAVNTKQILHRFDYFAYLNKIFNGIFDFMPVKRLRDEFIILDSFNNALAAFLVIQELVCAIINDERIMKNTKNPNDEQLSNIELRSELNSRNTPVERKLQIIRILFDRGKCLLMEEVDRNLYYELCQRKLQRQKAMDAKTGQK